jgi:hypothetical protein
MRMRAFPEVLGAGDLAGTSRGQRRMNNVALVNWGIRSGTACDAFKLRLLGPCLLQAPGFKHPELKLAGGLIHRNRDH